MTKWALTLGCLFSLSAQNAHSNDSCILEELKSSLTSLNRAEDAYLATVKKELGVRQSLTARELGQVVEMLKGPSRDSAQRQREIVKTFASKVQNLNGADLVLATSSIEKPFMRSIALKEGLPAIQNLKAQDLVDVVASLKGKWSSGQHEIIKDFASKVRDFDSSKLELLSNSIDDPHFKEKAIKELKSLKHLDSETQKTEFAGKSKNIKRSKTLKVENPQALTPQPAEITSAELKPNPPPKSEPKVSSPLPLTSSTALDELKGMPGMEKITDQLGKIREFLAVSKQRENEGLQAVRPTLHARFDGNPGTGKTTVARLYGKMLRELGFLKSADGKAEVAVIEKSGTDFTSSDAVEEMKKAIKEAQGGVLILDELYMADVKTNPNAKRAMGVLLKEMEDKRDQFVVIGTGYSKEMDDFISSNDGFKRRFAQKVNFEDYDDATLSKILKKVASEKDYHIDNSTIHSVIQKLSRQRGKGFGNAGTVRNEFEAAIQRHAARLSKHPNATKEDLKTLKLEDFHPPSNASIPAKLAALDKMAGLDEVKKNIRSVVSLLEQEHSRAQHGLKADRPLLNAIFEGNPGTGKTTVGEMYGSLLKDLGYVSNGEFIYVKAGDLLGDVVGASEAKTKELLKRAKGNVLFIDEAYRLYQPGSGNGSSSFGKAVLDTLVEEIKPDANQDMVVIMGGYSREMANMMSANSGLSRRFPRNFHFADYTPEQLMGILLKKAQEKGLVLSPEAQKAALAELNLRRSAKDFGNAGEVENLLGAALLHQSERLAATGRKHFAASELKKLQPGDFRGPRKSPDEVLKQLDSTPGLTSVKRVLHDIKDTHEEAALADLSPHSLFGGAYSFEGRSPEEQKKVAEVLGELLHSQGILPKKGLEVADSTALKGQYIGESAAKTRQLLENSLGKTLIIKDLGAISNPNNPYEKEASDTIASFLQQNHGKLAVVFSGTPEEVSRFTSLNPQIARKIEHVLEFHDLSAKESVTHLSQLFHSAGKTLSPSASSKLNEVMSHLLAEPGWGNAKNLEDFKTRILIKQAVRQKRTPGGSPTTIEAIDIEAAVPSGLMRRQPAAYGQHDLSLNTGHGAGHEAGLFRGKEAEHAAVATESRATSSHAPEHEHAEVKGHELSRAGVQLTERSKKIMNGLQDLLNPNDPAGVEEMKRSMRQGKLSPPLLEKLAKQLQTPVNPANLSRLSVESTIAIKEMKEGAELLKERAKTDVKAKKMIDHYVCLVCGRSSCSYMPYTWFTEEF
jgi:SpoVK/Ycf46/Vps4 family AAA+-type ATPase